MNDKTVDEMAIKVKEILFVNIWLEIYVYISMSVLFELNTNARPPCLPCGRGICFPEILRSALHQKS